MYFYKVIKYIMEPENENIEELNENEVNLLIYSRDPISVTELYKIIGL